MQNSAMKSWLDYSWLAGANQSYMEQLYEDFLTDPESVDKVWRTIFRQISSTSMQPERCHSSTREYFRRLAKDSHRHTSIAIDSATNFKQFKVLQLIDAFRLHGHRYATLDPLCLWKKENIPELDLAYYNLSNVDFQKYFNVGSFAAGKEIMKLADLYLALQKIYCGNIGVEYMHVNNAEEKNWIQQHLESIINHVSFNKKEQINILKDLTAAEGLEKYLGVKFPGAKRFSLEGGDVLVPMLREMIRYSSKHGTREIILGMAHRGRLNLLINVFGKKPQDLFNEFSGQNKEYFGTGDVKYHIGFSSNFQTENGIVHLELCFNPSHLEIVNPVVMGSVRARLDCLEEGIDSNTILPITIHGDAAIIGQGVVQETLNMSQARGYEVGGTIHIIINNQIGFTTSNPKDSRSTFYCTDIGKMVLAPIFHVNSDDPEAVIFVIRLALQYRNKFKRDVFIDLVCYRRHGHNETDEPSVTQPLMYQKIKKHPTVRKIYATQLEKKGIATLEDSNKMITLYRDALDIGECVVPEWCPMTLEPFICSPRVINHEDNDFYPQKIQLQHLQSLARHISNLPKKITLHLRVAKIYNDRKEMAEGNKLFDWGGAENLAYATLIDKGISVRLSGEDCGRGTFFHRHAVIHDQHDGSTYVPLNHIHKNQAQFTVWDSVLSEEAVLAFEYGYAIANQHILNIWEAQFGDFANCAQVVIDQFISSGEQKWGCMCGLVMLLPHGYEGQGPEHSSARLERYLQLCAEQNMQICIPSTPAQIYHILRRQALRSVRRPLIVMSPKSLLRHPLALSSLEDLSFGNFQEVIDEIDDLNLQYVKRVILCSGKIYYDLLEQRRNNKKTDVAIVRIEQLYPFPRKVVQSILKKYSHIQDFIWCQEEPLNQGAWYYNQDYFREIIPCKSLLRYVGRPASAAPAVGHMSVHQQQQRTLINDALNLI